MVGYPVGIGVGAEDLTYAVAELEPGFEFSKMLRWRTYGILVNDLRTFSVQCDQLLKFGFSTAPRGEGNRTNSRGTLRRQSIGSSHEISRSPLPCGR